MKTKHIPVLLMLAAGLITCIVSFFSQVSRMAFVRNFSLALVLFYILGFVIRLVLERNLLKEDEEEEHVEEEADGENPAGQIMKEEEKQEEM